MIETVYGDRLADEVLEAYLRNLVNLLFKILPMRENEEKTLGIYLESLIRELVGFKGLFITVDNDASLTQILSILQYMTEHPECEVKTVRREVFRAISLCNKMRERYTGVDA